MASLKLSITGMHCGNCLTKVEKALAAVPGTWGATVDLERGSAEVSFDGAKAAPDRYIEAIRAVGYAAHVAA